MAYVYVDEPDGFDAALVCFVCSEPLKNPVRHAPGCDGLFCGACVVKAPSCPVCSESLRDRLSQDISPRLLAELDAVRVRCVHCSEVVLRKDFGEHESECGLECHHGCGERVARGRTAEHNKTCTHILMRCSATSVGCNFRGPRYKTQEHERMCSYVQIKPMLESFNTHVKAAQVDFGKHLVQTHDNYVVRVMAMERTVRQLSFHIQSGKKPLMIREHTHPLTEFDDIAELKAPYEGKYRCSLCSQQFDSGKVFHCETCVSTFDCCPGCFNDVRPPLPRSSTFPTPTQPGVTRPQTSGSARPATAPRPRTTSGRTLPLVPSAIASVAAIGAIQNAAVGAL